MENNNPIRMKTIKEAMSIPLGETFKNYFVDIYKLDWYFSKLYEKIGLIAMMVWCLYSIFRFVIGVI